MASSAAGCAMRGRWLVAGLLVLCLAGIARADPVVTLPLDGYYRPGKFFPIRVESDRAVDVQVQLPGGISSRARGTSLVLPAMSLSRTPGSVRVMVDHLPTDLPIRPLEANQRLIIRLGDARPVTWGDTQTVSVLLPSVRSADLSQWYESADAIAVDVPTGGSIDPSAVAAAQASGLRVILNETIPPDSPVRPRGPVDSLDDPRPYEVPFIASRPHTVRVATWLILALFAIATLGTALLRWRYAWLGIVLVSAGWVGWGAFRSATVSPITEKRVEVTFDEAGRTWTDQWTILTTLNETPFTHFQQALIHRPVFAGQAGAMNLTLEQKRDGWQYTGKLPRGGTIAFVSRWPGTRYLQASNESPVPTAAQSRGLFADMVKSYYLRRGDVLHRGRVSDENGPEVYHVQGGK